MKSFNPYFNFDGNAEAAFNHYSAVFNTPIAQIQRFSETEFAANLPENEKNRVMHVSLVLPNGSILMASDIMPSMGHSLIIGNNVFTNIECDSKEEANRFFEGLSQDGIVDMPMQEMFWGAYYGIVKDKFGKQWMINCTL